MAPLGEETVCAATERGSSRAENRSVVFILIILILYFYLKKYFL